MLEKVLWGSRYVVLVAVASSVLIAFGAFYMATVDVVYLLARLAPYASMADPTLRRELHADTVTAIVKALDGYLLGSILLIFALGLYELFIRKLAVAEGSGNPALLLHIKSLDDLKDRLAKVVLLVLVIEFFQHALNLSYRTGLDLVYLAVGLLLVGGALLLSSLASRSHS